MRLLVAAGLGVLAAVAVLALWAEPAEATTVCHATGNWCQGYAHVSTTTGGVASARCFSVRTTNTAPACSTGNPGITPVNEGTWQMAAGQCLTVYYFDTTTGAAPPLVPNKLQLRLFFDSSLATVIYNFYPQAAEPASGSSYTLCATSDGTPTGSPRAGTYNVHITAIKDNAPGGIGNYNIKSDGTAAVGTINGFDNGALRGQMLVSSLARSAYPAGSTFAYGTSGDEQATVTGTFTQPNGDNNVECAATIISDDATHTVGAIGATVDVDATTTLAQAFTIDQTFPFASGPYVPSMAVGCNAILTGLTWTIFASSGHGADITRLSDTVVASTTTFNIDPRINFDQDGSGAPDDLTVVKLGSSSGAVVSVLNRGETYYSEWYLLNARNEQLTRAMTHVTEDASDVACISHGSLTPASGKYSVTVAIPTGGSCAVTATEAGSPRYFEATNTDQADESGQSFAVSTLYFVDSHLEIDSTLTQDDFPTEDATETFDYFIRDDGAGGDDSDAVHGWCHVKTVRADVDIDTSGLAVAGQYRDPTTTVRSSGSTDTGSDGWTTTHLDMLATTPLGGWTWTCTATFNGNSGTDIEDFTIGVEGGGGETVYTGADPLTIYAGGLNNGTVPVAVHSRFLNGEARVGAASSIFVSVFDWPGMNPVITGASVVEVDSTNAPGAYAYNFTPPYSGAFLVTANTTDVDDNPIGAHNVIDVSSSDIAASLQEHRDGSIEVLMTSNFAGLGFDGFIFLLFWIAVLLFASYMGWLVLAGFSIPGILFTAIPTLGAMVPDLDFPTLLAFALLGFVLEVAANKWSWGGYESGKRKLRLGA